MKQPATVKRIPGPGAAMTVSLDGRDVGTYERARDGRGYRYRTINGGYGGVATARQAVEAIIELARRAS